MHTAFKKHLPVLMFTGLVLNLLLCSDPGNDPLEWRSKVVVPLTNERFTLGEQLDSLFDFDDVEVEKEDTIAFAVTQEDSVGFTRSEEAFDSMFYRVKLGTLAIKGAPEYSVPASFPFTGKMTHLFPVPLQKIKNVIFADTANNTLSIEIENASSSPLTDVTMTIPDIGVSTVNQIAAQSKHSFIFDVAGKKIDDTLKIGLEATSATAGIKTVNLRFSLNGLKVFSMNVLDSLVSFSRSYVNRYELTDTIKIDYVDIDDGYFVYSILNQSNLDFSLNCIHDHIWRASYCKERQYSSISDIERAEARGEIDSVNFAGGIPGAYVKAGPNTRVQLNLVNLSNNRLFPEWDDSLGKSITNVKYSVEMQPSGRWVTITALDSMLFTIATTSFKFKEMAGTLTSPIEYKVDTQKVAIDMPWNATVKDSLRGKFVLSEVKADLTVATKLTGDSFIDTLEIDFVVFDPESTVVQDTLNTQFRDVTNDSVFTRTIDITDVANLFSDSIAIAVKMRIPTGTYVRFSNDVEWFDKNIIGKMTVNAFTEFRLKAKLDWSIIGSVNMDLGTSRTEMDDAFGYFRKMKNREGIFEMEVSNYTNLNLSLFSLVAPDELMDTLDSLTLNETFNYLKNEELAQADGYINLFGDTGVTVPKRDSTTSFVNRLVLGEEKIDALLSADSLNFRWWIQFKPQPRDALKSTDFVDIKSRLGIRGTNNTDSLFIWE